MLRDINRYLQGEAPVIKAPPPDDETLASRHAQIVARIDAVKQQWRDAVGELDALIESSGIDRRKFNRSNQAKWIDKISAGQKKRPTVISYRSRWKNSLSVS